MLLGDVGMISKLRKREGANKLLLSNSRSRSKLGRDSAKKLSESSRSKLDNF